MNPDRFRMQERIKVLRSKMAEVILKHIPESGNVTNTAIQRCQIDLQHEKAELIALVTALNFLKEQDQLEHRAHINRG